MCGISGFIKFGSRLSDDELKKYSLDMSKTLIKRGPNAEGLWICKKNNLAMSHRRLSIIDLNKRSTQPMFSRDKRFVMIFNGEIYNFQLLRDQLKKKNIYFSTGSDTEVLLEAISFWGLEIALKKISGMFSIALWDKKKKTLSLIRDRMGIKPLYYYFDGLNFAFASEIKALKKLPWLEFVIDKKSLTSYVGLNYVPAPNSIYKNVKKVNVGEIIKIDLKKNIKAKTYWNLEKLNFSNQDYFLDGNMSQQLESLLEEKILSHMVSDVPLGVFLSGGVDSSLVASIAQRKSSKKISSFTIGFNETSFDEAKDAKEIANLIGTNHNEIYFSFNDFKRLIDDINYAYDEPFSDSSQLPTILLSEITKKKVTVAMSGDGGDELFAGYHRYFLARKFQKYILSQNKLFKRIVYNVIKTLPVEYWNNFGKFLPNKYGGNQFGDKIYKIANFIYESDENSFYERLISNIESPQSLLLYNDERKSKIFEKKINELFPDFVERMQFLDTITYLPDDILTKVDRASMHHSLEVRVPFLDHKVVEFARKLPINEKIKNNEGKIILKKILKKYLPKRLVEKKKMGFGIPLGKFINENLSKEIDNYLNIKKVEEQNLFDLKKYKKYWHEHKNGKRNWQYLIWNFFVFQRWYEKWH